MNQFDFDKIPECGFVYFESDFNVFVEEYRLYDVDLKCKHAQDILNSEYKNIDFFNEKKDVRYKRSGSGQNFELEFSSDEADEKDPLLYMEEELVLEDKYRFSDYSKIKIVNRFYFDDKNVIHLKNYRLVALLHEK